MQYQFTERLEYIKTIEFFNTNPLHIEKIRYFQEEGVTGTITKREFIYSWDNVTWSNWNTLTIGNLTAISFRDHQDFYLKLRYTRTGIGSGNIERWYLIYDELAPTPPAPPSPGGCDCSTFGGENPEYFLNRENHIGPYADLNVYNVADGSAIGVYSHKDDTSLGTNIYFKGLKGAGGVTIQDNNGIISISADVSVAAGTYIKEASLGPNFIWDASGYLDISVGSTPTGAGIDGGVWITNIIANGVGNVGDKSYSSSGAVLDYCLTDTSSLTVSILALPGHTNYKPVVTINGNPVTIAATADKPVFTGTYNMVYNFADASITVVHEDGARWSTLVDADTPAVILSANFIGNYPGTQTELKAGDTMQINVVTDVPITQIVWDNAGALTAGMEMVSGTSNIITVTIADRGDIAQLLGFTLRVRKSTGSTSLDYVSSTHGSVELVDLVKCNDLYPSISFGSIQYPGTQQAIKSPESATVNNTVNNSDTTTYTSPNGELTISSPNTYQTAKTVTYLSGSYNVTNNNFRITANRTANNSTTIGNTLVQIANVLPVINIAGTSNRLRSGGADGTAVQSHTITIQSNQRLLVAPITGNIPAGQGTWSGSWAGGPSNWTRNLLINDSDSKGSYSLSGLVATNLSGMVQGTINSGATYTLGGFVTRNISLAAFANEALMNVQATNYNNVTLTWAVKALPTRSAINTNPPIVGAWCLASLNTNPTTIRILDTEATGSSSQASTITIQETA